MQHSSGNNAIVRIIGGEFRSRKLLDPVDDATRPVTDRVKQSIFDILSPRLDGAVIYDIFAGTGSFGLESLSRGAASCVFFERHRPAVERLRRNIDTLGVGDRCRVETGDIFKLDFTRFAPADIAFFDPPYRFVHERTSEIERLATSFARALAPEGVLLFRHDAADDDVPIALPEQERRTWGAMTVRFLTWQGDVAT